MVTAVRWDKLVYLAIGLVILGSALFFVGFLLENRSAALPAGPHRDAASGLPIRHVGFSLTAVGNLILVLALLGLANRDRWEDAYGLAKAEGRGELVHGFRFTFALLLLIGLVTAALFGRSLFSPPRNFLLWLMGFCFPWVIRLVLLPVGGRLPRGEMGAILKSLLVVCWGLLLLQLLIGLIATFPPPLSNLVLSGLLVGLAAMGLRAIRR